MSAEHQFRTDFLPFAAFLLSKGSLKFTGCEHHPQTGRAFFIFNDPQGEGEQLKLAFECGAECSAMSFYESIRRLRKVMDASATIESKGARSNAFRSS